MDQNEIKHNKEIYQGKKYFKMVCLTAGFLALGLPISMIGPTLPTLAYNMHIDVTEIAFVIPAKGVGSLTGSVLSGVIFNRIDQQLMVCFCLLLTAIGTILIPFVQTPVFLAILLFSVHVSMGALDTGGNVLCLQLWGVDSEPYMQTLHFFFALGAALAPLIAQPFINDAMNINLTTESRNISADIYTVPHVFWAFLIPSVLSSVVSASFLYLSCSSDGVFGTSQEDTRKTEGLKFRTVLLGFLFVFFMLYVGLEIGFGIFIYTFSIESQLQYSKVQGTALNFLFWLCFSVGRFFAIPLTRYLSPKVMLTFDLMGSTTAVILMLFLPLYAQNADFIFWIAVGLFGWSMASVFPSGISWAERYITMTGRSASILVIGASLGKMIVPTLLGTLMYNPAHFLYFCLICVICNVLTFVIMQKYASRQGLRLQKSERESSYDLVEKEPMAVNKNNDEIDNH